MTDAAIETAIQQKGLTAPRVTPDDIKQAIVSEHYFTAFDGMLGVVNSPNPSSDKYDPHWEVPRSHQALGLLTFCVLVLKNGFTVTGESACASPENFDAELGRTIARRNAEAKIWPLLGYELRSLLAGHVALVPPPAPAAPNDFKTRLYREHEELQMRTQKLAAFIGTDVFEKLPHVEREDLRAQFGHMQRYQSTLFRRLSRLAGAAEARADRAGDAR